MDKTGTQDPPPRRLPGEVTLTNTSMCRVCQDLSRRFTMCFEISGEIHSSVFGFQPYLCFTGVVGKRKGLLKFSDRRNICSEPKNVRKRRQHKEERIIRSPHPEMSTGNVSSRLAVQTQALPSPYCTCCFFSAFSFTLNICHEHPCTSVNIADCHLF